MPARLISGVGILPIDSCLSGLHNAVVKGIKDSDYYKKYVDQAKSIKAIEDFNKTVNPVTEITGVHKDAFIRTDESKITDGHPERLSISAIAESARWFCLSIHEISGLNQMLTKSDVDSSEK